MAARAVQRQGALAGSALCLHSTEAATAWAATLCGTCLARYPSFSHAHARAESHAAWLAHTVMLPQHSLRTHARPFDRRPLLPVPRLVEAEGPSGWHGWAADDELHLPRDLQPRSTPAHPAAPASVRGCAYMRTARMPLQMCSRQPAMRRPQTLREPHDWPAQLSPARPRQHTSSGDSPSAM